MPTVDKPKKLIISIGGVTILESCVTTTTMSEPILSKGLDLVCGQIGVVENVHVDEIGGCFEIKTKEGNYKYWVDGHCPAWLVEGNRVEVCYVTGSIKSVQ